MWQCHDAICCHYKACSNCMYHYAIKIIIIIKIIKKLLNFNRQEIIIIIIKL